MTLGEPNLRDREGGGANCGKQVLWRVFAAGQRPDTHCEDAGPRWLLLSPCGLRWQAGR